MSQNVVFKTLFHNLKLLGFQKFLNSVDKKVDRLQFDENMFEKQNEKAFELVTYFLFTTLDKGNKNRFIGCFPCYDRKQVADFRKSATECFRELEKKQDCQIKFLPVLLHNPVGVQFCNLYISLSNYVLAKYMKKRFHFEERYSQLDDQRIKSVIYENLEKYDRNEQELVKLKSYWESNAKYFVERHITLRKQLQDIKMSMNEPTEVFDQTALLKEIQKLESDWESLYSSVLNITTECKEQLQLVDDELESSFDVTKITNKKEGASNCSLDLCEMFRSSQKPIKLFFAHIDSMSTSKLQDIYSHITLAKVQMAKHNVVVAEMNKKIKEEYEALDQSFQKLKSDLLNNEAVKRRKDWFRERLPAAFPKLIFEPKQVENISSLLVEAPKPVFEKYHRISDARYSFHFADISTLHYVPPPIMEESCILSPVRERIINIDSSNSFDLEKEREQFNACD